MHFGLTNTHAVFQALVNEVLRDFIFVYLDDILIFSWNPQEHTLHEWLVLQRLLENELFIKAEKCKFNICSVSFLEYIIESGQVRADPEKIWVVAEWPKLTTLKQIQRFSHFTNFYHHFIQDDSRVAAPLMKLTSTLTPLT